MPELVSLDGKAAARLADLAPVAREGKFRKKFSYLGGKTG